MSQSSIKTRIILPIIIVNGIFIVVCWLALNQTIAKPIQLGILGGLAITSLITLWLLLDNILCRRLTELNEYIANVANPAISSSSAPNDSSNDELASSTKALATFIKKLHDTLEELKNSARKSQQFSSKQAEKINQSGAKLQTNTHELEQITTAIQQVAATSTDLSSNAQTITTTVREVAGMIEHGSQASSSNQASMNTLAKTVETMTNNVAQLQEESAQIGSVLDVIGSIAEQTNLLALNAAIEAARAGEQGRGFAVVADEVRALAHRTQEATVEIQKMVEGLQTKAQAAVKAMEQGRELSHNSLEQSQNIEQLLAKIHDVINKVTSLTLEIANGTHSQTVTTNNINKQIQSIADQSREACANLSAIAERSIDQQENAREVETTLMKLSV